MVMTELFVGAKVVKSALISTSWEISEFFSDNWNTGITPSLGAMKNMLFPSGDHANSSIV